MSNIEDNIVLLILTVDCMYIIEVIKIRRKKSKSMENNAYIETFAVHVYDEN